VSEAEGKKLNEYVEKPEKARVELTVEALMSLSTHLSTALHHVANELKDVADEVRALRKTMSAMYDVVADLTTVMRDYVEAQRPKEPSYPESEFPKCLRAILDFREVEGGWEVWPREYLGDRFRDVVAIVRKLGGEYISKGRDSHFFIPKKPEGVGEKR